MTDYVAGFLMNAEDSGSTVLVSKLQPEWQRGLLNGVGGKIEEGEHPYQAMVREFQEETGLLVEDWELMVTLLSGEHTISFFRARRPFAELVALHGRLNDVGEELLLVSCIDAQSRWLVLPNLRWLLPLAQYRHDNYWPLTVQEREGRG